MGLVSRIESAEPNLRSRGLPIRKIAISVIIVGLASSGVFFVILPVISGSTSPAIDYAAAVYFDDMAVTADGKTVLSERFDSTDLWAVGWQRISMGGGYAALLNCPSLNKSSFIKDWPSTQAKYSHSSPYGLNRSLTGSSSPIRKPILVDSGWKNITCTMWIMLPSIARSKDQLGGNARLLISSGSSNSSISMGVSVMVYGEGSPYGDNNYVLLSASYELYPGAFTLNSDGYPMPILTSNTEKGLPLIPYKWHKLSIVVTSASGKAQLYMDDALSCQLTIPPDQFKTIGAITLT